MIYHPQVATNTRPAFQEGLVHVGPETGHFARGAHLHPQPRVRVFQAPEAEHGALAGHEVDVHGLDHRLVHLGARHDPGGHLDEVHLTGKEGDRYIYMV